MITGIIAGVISLLTAIITAYVKLRKSPEEVEREEAFKKHDQQRTAIDRALHPWNRSS